MARVSEGINSVPYEIEEGDTIQDAFVHARIVFGLDPTDEFLIVLDGKIADPKDELTEDSHVVIVVLEGASEVQRSSAGN